MRGEVQSLSQQFGGLIQIDDQVTQSRTEHERLHVFVQQCLFVAVVHSRIVQIFDSEQIVHLKEIGMLEGIYC